jgi:class 3 adenylate cyclase/CHASE2 domain-containing sensor protein
LWSENRIDDKNAVTTSISQKARSHIVPVLLTLLVTVVVLATYSLWESLELKAYDFKLRAVERFGLMKGGYTGNAVVVDMEEGILMEEKPLIFWYPEIGEFLYKMNEYGASSVAIDLIPIHSLGEKIIDAADSSFPSGMNECGAEFLDEFGQYLDNSLMGALLDASDGMDIVQGVAGGTVPYYYSLMAFMADVHKASVSLSLDRDKIIRRQRLRYEDSLDSFAYTVYRLKGGTDVDRDTVALNYSLGSSIPRYSFSDILQDKVAPEKFRGKSVMLGYISGYDDTHPTPLETLDGILLHAITVETLFSGTFMSRLPFRVEVLLLVVLILTGLLFSTRLSPFTPIIGVFTVMASYMVFNIYMFQKFYLVPVFPQILSPLVVFSFIFPYRYFLEEKKKRRIYKTFSYYMDRSIIDTLVGRDLDALLKGEQKHICVMFTDIRDFTSMTQQLSAENIISFLNAYFGRLTGIIQKHNGFIDKLIGDAVLAFFVSEGNPVDNALRCSDEIVKEVERINNDTRISGITGGWRLRTGIGLDYGKVVMGNIGSERKMDFTIIGEPVNRASRLEGLTKRFDSPILITDSAHKASGGDFDFKHLGLIEVRGIKEPVDIYTVIG